MADKYILLQDFKEFNKGCLIALHEDGFYYHLDINGFNKVESKHFVENNAEIFSPFFMDVPILLA